MDQPALMPLIRSLILGGAFSCTVLGLLFFIPPSRPILKERIFLWTGSTQVAPSLNRAVRTHSSKPSVTGGFLLLVGILLFVRFFISELG